jgi:murein DD-endopeptidase MepM/ murein hydrolase activator NlpD
MVHSTGVFLLSIKFLVICVLVAANTFLVIFLFHDIKSIDPRIYTHDALPSGEQKRAVNSPNSISRSLDRTVLIVNTTIEGTFNAIDATITSGVKRTSSVVSSATAAIGSTVGSLTDTIGNTADTFTSGVATSITQPETIIKPEPLYAIPKIQSAPQPASGAQQNKPANSQSSAAVVSSPEHQIPEISAWPLNGTVTTEFGVPHRPYQPRHTGIDISSYSRSGGASITSFRTGVVIDVIQSRHGLGNHVIIDHGRGLTSYYCHLSSITAKKGQSVKPGDIIGREGSTGTSTGPHLHFEIHEDNIPVNPRKYIDGNP